jgi:serine/threonine protein phosphatase PrpC
VSDGAGSSHYSRIGSEITVRELTNGMAAWFRDQAEAHCALDKHALEAAMRAKITSHIGKLLNLFNEQIAPSSQAHPRDFRCTLLMAVWRRTTNTEVLVTTQIGDGFFALRDKTSCRRIGKSDSGDFSGEVTCFIPDPQAPDFANASFESLHAEDVDTLLLCTDGIEDPFYPPQKFAPLLFNELQNGVVEAGLNEAGIHHPIALGPVLGTGTEDGLEALSQWISFEKRGENDDRTIVAIERYPKPDTTL